MTWHRTSRQARGYGAAWDRLRLQILERDCYLCQCLDCQGGLLRVREAQEVDHIKPRAWFADGRAIGDPDDPSNLRAVASACHRQITLEQQGKKAKRRIGLDGFPIDEDK